MKLLVDELESAALACHLSIRSADDPLVASWLLHTELHCAAARYPDEVDAESVRILLDAITLVDLTRGDLVTAGTVPGRLRSNEAMHLTVALRVGADEVITYDDELGQAARTAGLAVIAPS